MHMVCHSQYVSVSYDAMWASCQSAAISCGLRWTPNKITRVALLHTQLPPNSGIKSSSIQQDT